MFLQFIVLNLLRYITDFDVISSAVGVQIVQLMFQNVFFSLKSCNRGFKFVDNRQKIFHFVVVHFVERVFIPVVTLAAGSANIFNKSGYLRRVEGASIILFTNGHA